MSSRRALAYAVGRYRHEELKDLLSPRLDAELMKQVLDRPDLGGFDSTEVLLNADSVTVRTRLWDFLWSGTAEDLLFVYVSCHGRKVGQKLYLTAIDTDPERLPPTAISADDLGNWIDESRAGTVVLVLDCCHAGALDWQPAERARRERVVILTASSVEYAREGVMEIGRARPSPFAAAFFGGIESGRADSNSDGHVTVREAFDFARSAILADSDTQHPRIRISASGDVVVSRSPVNEGGLTRDLLGLVASSIPSARAVAVKELSLLLGSRSSVTAEEAAGALIGLRDDPDTAVARLAEQKLGQHHRRTVLHADLLRDPAVAGDGVSWHEEGIFYEVRVRSFFDSNEDGIGDLAGLESKLDYLQWLGVGAVVLAPVFDSPREDDGFDIRDYRGIDPDVGDLGDFVSLVDAAHQRGLRIVLDVVLNHTSIEHPWFQASRNDPAGPHGDYYVWEDTNELYSEIAGEAWTGGLDDRWSYDRRRRQYYWHRFSAHEPDLNFDHPAVRAEISGILRYWFDLGVDGFRLLTAPFLFERDGSPSAGAAETHHFLGELREYVETNFPGRILIAWTDRWPDEASSYFGSERAECHVVLYASLMPGIFLAMRRENHHPLSGILARSAEISPNGAWGVFLRNGDEMSLRTVSEEDRDYLLREYAPATRMRHGSGIRRRLASLMDGNTTALKLCMSLLASLPGVPILYYGDEIGMGENLSLGGNAGLRTPMQWTADRSAGFSDAEPEHLVSPVLLGSVYGYSAVNVQSQQRSAVSLLQVTQQLLEVRRHSDALTRGGFAPVGTSNEAILAYVRRGATETILVVSNFSQSPQAGVLRLQEYAHHELVEITGGARFPRIGEGDYLMSLAGHGYFWLRIQDVPDATPSTRATPGP